MTMPAQEDARLWRYHKSSGSTLPKAVSQARAIGDLDAVAEGLLLLTNDRDVQRLMELASAGWVRRYRVKAKARADDALLSKLGDGIEMNGVHYGPIEHAYDKPKAWLHIAMREGRGRGIGGVCSFLELASPKIVRMAFGPFELGELKAGAIEEVPAPSWRGTLGGKFGTKDEDRRRQVQRAPSRSAGK
jgi:23S rRNA pseudouridine2605 synthase